MKPRSLLTAVLTAGALSTAFLFVAGSLVGNAVAVAEGELADMPPMPGEPGRLPEPLVVAAPARPPGELVVNGGFEAPALDDGSWDVFGAIPGWRTARGPGIELQRGAAGAPAEGAQLVELDSHAGSSMYQILATRQGATYRLSYRVSARPGTSPEDNQLEVRWNGVVVDRFVATTAVDQTRWQTRSVVVTGRGREARLELVDVSPSNSLGAYVDDVSVRLEQRRRR